MGTIIDSTECKFLKSQLDSGNNIAARRALQQICFYYRKGRRFGKSSDLLSIEQSIVGLLFTRSEDQKIRRWALNAIAQLGRKAYSIVAVRHALELYGADPETVASALAALAKLEDDEDKVRAIIKPLDPSITVLAMLQNRRIDEIPIRHTQIDIERSSVETLKLSLVLVGMNRAPENLFHPRHENSVIVKVLGRHDDPLVSQYSVWAITENPNLSIRHLGIDLRTIESLPPNIRSWVLQLIAMDLTSATGNFDYIVAGSKDDHPEARRGLTVGLKGTYIDAFEPIAKDWYFSEPEEEVRHGIIDHFVRQSPRSASYHQIAGEIYQDEQEESPLRLRMMANAAGLPIFGDFRRANAEDQMELFGQLVMPTLGMGQMKKNVVNVHGNVIGNVTVGDEATNSGETKSAYNENQILSLNSELSLVQKGIFELDIDEEKKNQANQLIKEIQEDPSSDKIKTLIEFLKNLKDGVNDTGKFAGNVSRIAAFIGVLVNFL